MQNLYLNGVLQGQAAAAGNLDLGNPNMAFGAKKSDSGSDFNSQIDGWIDEVAIYDVALTAGAIRAGFLLVGWGRLRRGSGTPTARHPYHLFSIGAVALSAPLPTL